MLTHSVDQIATFILEHASFDVVHHAEKCPHCGGVLRPAEARFDKVDALASSLTDMLGFSWSTDSSSLYVLVRAHIRDRLVDTRLPVGDEESVREVAREIHQWVYGDADDSSY